MGRYKRRGERFDLGIVFVSPEVRKALGFQAVYRLLNRHARGDWGEGYIGRGDRNDRFLRLGLRLDSHYLLPCGHQVWISTDPRLDSRSRSRRSTEVFLVREYEDIFG